MPSLTDSLPALINDILGFSNREDRQLEMERTAFNLRGAVEDVTDMLAVEAHKKGLAICSLVNQDVPTLVNGDSGKLRHVLINLIGNSIKFTEKGEVFIRVSLEEESVSHISARFVVTDTGIGITAGRLSRLLKSSSPTDPSLEIKDQAAGHGLDISKMMVEIMGGSIGVESEEGKGTSCWFTVSFKKVKEAGNSEIIVSEDLRSKRILVVGGHTADRLVLGALLQTWGCRYDEAAGGAQALDKLHQAVARKDPFHIALLDMQRPEMDGKTLGLKIKADFALRDTRLGLIAPIEQHVYEDEIQKIGFGACLTRPIKKSNLYECLYTLLGLSAGQANDAIASRQGCDIYSKKDREGQINILLAEDNAENKKIALRILGNLGCSAEVVENGEKVIAALEAAPYDLVLMDVARSELKGLEAIGIIRDPQSMVCNHNVPVVAITAHTEQGEQEKYLESGMDDYINMPITDLALSGVLQKYLPFNETVVLKIEHLHQIANGDPTFVQEMMALFLFDNKKRLLSLEAALHDLNAQQFEYEAHVMHGSCASAGAKRMKEIASQLEQIGAGGELSPAFAGLDNLKLEFKQVARYFQEYMHAQKSLSMT